MLESNQCLPLNIIRYRSIVRSVLHIIPLQTNPQQSSSWDYLARLPYQATLLLVLAGSHSVSQLVINRRTQCRLFFYVNSIIISTPHILRGNLGFVCCWCLVYTMPSVSIVRRQLKKKPLILLLLLYILFIFSHHHSHPHSHIHCHSHHESTLFFCLTLTTGDDKQQFFHYQFIYVSLWMSLPPSSRIFCIPGTYIPFGRTIEESTKKISIHINEQTPFSD